MMVLNTVNVLQQSFCILGHFFIIARESIFTIIKSIVKPAFPEIEYFEYRRNVDESSVEESPPKSKIIPLSAFDKPSLFEAAADSMSLGTCIVQRPIGEHQVNRIKRGEKDRADVYWNYLMYQAGLDYYYTTIAHFTGNAPLLTPEAASAASDGNVLINFARPEMRQYRLSRNPYGTMPYNWMLVDETKGRLYGLITQEIHTQAPTANQTAVLHDWRHRSMDEHKGARKYHLFGCRLHAAFLAFGQQQNEQNDFSGLDHFLETVCVEYVELELPDPNLYIVDALLCPRDGSLLLVMNTTCNQENPSIARVLVNELPIRADNLIGMQDIRQIGTNQVKSLPEPPEHASFFSQYSFSVNIDYNLNIEHGRNPDDLKCESQHWVWWKSGQVLATVVHKRNNPEKVAILLLYCSYDDDNNFLEFTNSRAIQIDENEMPAEMCNLFESWPPQLVGQSGRWLVFKLSTFCFAAVEVLWNVKSIGKVPTSGKNARWRLINANDALMCDLSLRNDINKGQVKVSVLSAWMAAGRYLHGRIKASFLPTTVRLDLSPVFEHA